MKTGAILNAEFEVSIKREHHTGTGQIIYELSPKPHNEKREDKSVYIRNALSLSSYL